MDEPVALVLKLLGPSVLDSLHTEVASADPHPGAVVLVAQPDPVAVSVIVIFLCVVADELLRL